MKTYYTILILLTIILLNTQFSYSQWVQTNGPGGGYITSIAVIGANVIVGTNEGVFLSSDNGSSWREANNGLPSIPRISSIAVHGASIILGCERTPTDPGGVYFSTDYGANWISKGLSNYSILSLALNGTGIFAGTDTGGIFLSTNNGTDWSKVNNGLPISYVYTLCTSGNNIFAGTDSGVVITTDFGANWTKVNNGLNNNIYVRAIAINGNNVFAGTMNGLFLSTNKGANWTPVNNGLNDNMIISLAVTGNTIFAGARGWPNGGGVYRSTDNGANWKQVSLDGYMILSLAADGDNVYAGAIVFGGPNYIRGIYFSLDSGTNWTKVGLPIISVDALFVQGDNIYSSAVANIFLSSDNGTYWKESNLNYHNNTNTIIAISGYGSYIFAGTVGKGIFLSSDNGTNWTIPVNGAGFGTFIHSFVIRSNNVFAGTGNGVLLSTDNGSNWSSAGLPNYTVFSLAESGTNIYAGTGNGVFLTTNDGTNWTQINNGLTDTTVIALTSSGNNIYAGTDNGGVYWSKDNGANWSAINNGIPNYTKVNSMIVSGTDIFISTDSGIYRSTNDGTNWINIGLNNFNVQCLTVNEEYLFAGTVSGAWKRLLSDFALPVELTSFTSSVGKGSITLKWKTATELNNRGFEVERSGNKAEWKSLGFVKGSGNSTSPISYSYVDKSIGKEGKYYYRLKQIDIDGTFKYSSVAEIELGSPSTFALNQNYPNPFNPSTRISYTLKDKGFVKLKVFDVRGGLVKVLVSESKDAGYYETEFDGKGLASGVYIYRIEVMGDGNRSVYSDMKKTVLLK
jgi:photosystem II stability/assembly factor-like uncharacterized protein